jgi:hypothetical protein
MRIRHLEERLAREQLLIAQRELRQSQDAYRVAHEALVKCSAPSAPSPIDDVRWRYDQATRLADALHDRSERLLEAASRRDEAVMFWKSASQRAEVLTRLNADSFAQWRAKLQREEVGEMDDLTTARYSWNAVRT